MLSLIRFLTQNPCFWHLLLSLNRSYDRGMKNTNHHQIKKSRKYTYVCIPRQWECKQDWNSLLAEQCTLQAWCHKEKLPDFAKTFSSAACFLWTVIFFSSRLLNLLYCTRQSKFGLLFAAGAAPLHRAVQKALGHGTEPCVVLGDYSSPLLICLTIESFTLLKDFTNWIFFKSCAEAVPLWLNDIRIFKKKKKSKSRRSLSAFINDI